MSVSPTSSLAGLPHRSGEGSQRDVDAREGRPPGALQRHPLGTEARVFVDGELHRTQVFRDQATMITETTAWREAFEGKGWR